MKIVIDLQGAQACNSNRGIGRYSRQIAKELCKINSSEIEIHILLNGFFLEKGIKEWLEGDNYAAISRYTKAIKLKPNFSNAYIARCGSFVNINRSKDAIKDCN